MFPPAPSSGERASGSKGASLRIYEGEAGACGGAAPSSSAISDQAARLRGALDCMGLLRADASAGQAPKPFNQRIGETVPCRGPRYVESLRGGWWREGGLRGTATRPFDAPRQREGGLDLVYRGGVRVLNIVAPRVCLCTVPALGGSAGAATAVLYLPRLPSLPWCGA